MTILLAIYCAYDVANGLIAAWGFTTDDVYISLVYARQLVSGKGLLWPGSTFPVEGYSNFLWVLIAALAIKLKFPLIASMKIISCLCLGAGLVFMYRLGRLFFSPLLAMLPVFIFSHYYGVIWWTVSGLETMLYFSLSLVLVLQIVLAFGYQINNDSKLTDSRISTRAWLIANITLLLLSLTRFEGLIWTVPVLVFALCESRYGRLKDFFLSNELVYLWGRISLICFIVPYCGYFIWRLYYFGHFIPNSFTCKALSTGQFFVIDLDYVQVIISLIVASLPYLISKKDCRHVLLWMPSVLYAAMLWNADPVITYLLRLFMAPLALYSLLAVLGVQELVNYFKLSEWVSKLIISLVIILITCLFIQGNNVHHLQRFVAYYQEKIKNRLQVANILNTQATKGASVLVGDCGVIPFNTREDIRIIDSQCLNNYEMARFPYRNNLELYAKYLEEQIKPDWVITNYYPLDSHGDILGDFLKERNFLENYQLVATLKSGTNTDPEGNHKIIDYIYEIYKRR